MLRWFQTTLILFTGLALTTVVIQFATIRVLDITAGRLLTTGAIAVVQGTAIALLLRRRTGGEGR